jgi:peptidyl-tRNA hydrolase, PTH1 family
MKLIVGLGNPGIEYQFTPHNMGFLAIDRVAERCGARISNRHAKALTARAKIGGTEVLLAKPETYMNLSGMSVRELVERHEINRQKDLLLVYDELDLPLGAMRIRERGSSAGHNGMQSVLNALGTDEVARMRLGVGPGHPVKDGARFVLGQWKKAQLKQVDEVLERAADAIEMIVNDGIMKAMSLFNRREEQAAGI